MGKQPTFHYKPSSESLRKRRLLWNEEEKWISGSKSCLRVMCQTKKDTIQHEQKVVSVSTTETLQWSV